MSTIWTDINLWEDVNSETKKKKQLIKSPKVIETEANPNENDFTHVHTAVCVSQQNHKTYRVGFVTKSKNSMADTFV